MKVKIFFFQNLTLSSKALHFFMHWAIQQFHQINYRGVLYQK